MLVAVVVWFVVTVVELPPLHKPGSEGGSQSVLAVLAGFGALAYAVAAARYWYVYRGRLSLLPASVIACFILLAEAMIGVALTGERAWHAKLVGVACADRYRLCGDQLRRATPVAR